MARWDGLRCQGLSAEQAQRHFSPFVSHRASGSGWSVGHKARRRRCISQATGRERRGGVRLPRRVVQFFPVFVSVRWVTTGRRGFVAVAAPTERGRRQAVFRGAHIPMPPELRTTLRPDGRRRQFQGQAAVFRVTYQMEVRYYITRERHRQGGSL